MDTRKWIVGIILSILVLISSTLATTYYVDSNGSDDANGLTLQTAWKTIQEAANTLTAGDTVYIKGGTYTEQVKPQSSGSDGNYITYEAYENEEVIIKPATGKYYCIYLDISKSLSYLKFKNLKLKDAKYGFGAGIGPEAKSHLILENLELDNSYMGIYFWAGVSDSEIKNCTLKGNQYGIVITRGCENILIHGNSLSDPNLDPGVRYGMATGSYADGNELSDHIRLTASYAPLNHGITITDNQVLNSLRQGILVQNSEDVLIEDNFCCGNEATGIQIEGNVDLICKNIVIQNNLCEFNGWKSEAGIWVDDTNYALVQNNIVRCNNMGIRITGTLNTITRDNLIYDNHREDEPNWVNTGIMIHGSPQCLSVTGKGGAHNIVVHNTIHRNGHTRALDHAYAQVTINYAGGGAYPNIYNTAFKNNIASESLSSNPILDLSVEGATATQFLNYNNYYHPDRELQMRWQTSDVNWTNYLAISGQDANSITSAPLFVSYDPNDPNNADFNLNANSPCIDHGDFLTITTNDGVDSNLVEVADARYFCDGYGITDGDSIQINDDVVQVTNVNYDANSITINQNISWDQNDAVSYPYNGTRPDIGAKESED